MTVKNVIELGHLAELYNIESLLKDCAAFIVSNNVEMKEEEENSGRHGSPSTTCHRQAGAVTSKTSLISERQHIVKMDQNKTKNRIYWKPAIAATSRSLMLVGKEAIGSHIYNMCGVLMAKDMKELVIYIRDMTAEELVAFQDSEAATPISLPRYMENGTRSMKDFNGFAYQGEIHGTSRALQAVDVHSVGNNGGSRISAYWRAGQAKDDCEECGRIWTISRKVQY